MRPPSFRSAVLPSWAWLALAVVAPLTSARADEADALAPPVAVAEPPAAPAVAPANADKAAEDSAIVREALESPLDFARRENWAVNDADRPQAAEGFDVFYVYPTLCKHRDSPLMDCRDPAMRAKAAAFAAAQTRGVFGENVRVFAPLARQVEFGRCLALLRQGAGAKNGVFLTSPGVADTLAALRHFLRHCRPAGRPYVLLGHSQGAMDILAALRRAPEATPQDGLVAAYLPGLPGTTAEGLRRAFAGRGIAPTQGPADVGVIAVWNTQRPDAENPLFARPGGYGVNPLNWRTDATPAPASANLGYLDYDWRHPERAPKMRPGLCGATFSPEKGAVLVDLPAGSRHDANGMLGLGVFHADDVWLFAGNLAANARERVAAWRQRHGK